MPFVDLSTQGTHDKVRRVVRPNEHVGTAFGGDEILIDASELNHPAVAGAVWTAEERDEAEQKAEEARRARTDAPVNATSRAVDEQLARAAKERAAKKEKARTSKPDPDAEAQG